jgi:hypothetical protein
MPYVQADLVALDAATLSRARGEQVQDIQLADGRRIRYATMDEEAVERLRARILADIADAEAAAGGVRRARAFRGSMSSGY